MRIRATERVLAAAVLALAGAAPSVTAQHREYYVRGRATDTDGKPLPDVHVRLVEAATSRAYEVHTDRAGSFKIAGLSHGVYRATFSKDGFAPREDEWKLEKPQDTMQKVDVPPVALARAAQVEDARRRSESEVVLRQVGEALRGDDPEGALALLGPLLEKDPRDARALFLAALADIKGKRHADAVPRLQKVVELTPDFAGAHFQLGQCRRALGDARQAAESFDRALALDPANVESAYNAGLVLFEAGRADEALVRFEKGLVLRPLDPELHEMAARCLVRKSDFAGALIHLEKARTVTTDPARAGMLDRLLEEVRRHVR
jgi:tetratricopeptide (TPR) repeat protein